MAKWGKFDFGAFKDFAESFKKTVDGKVVDKFIEDFLTEMAMRALAKIKKRTPTAKQGTTPNPGNLKRSWKVSKVIKQGDTYIVEIYNDARYGGESYASFVEYGHRAGKNLNRWVEGRFMMTISMKEIERELPRYLERRVTALLNDVMRGIVPRR